jgi:aldose 1-epimerase
MKISKKTFGVLCSGEEVLLYTLEAGDLVFSISTLGATWVSLIVPSKKTPPQDILLGFSTLEGYTKNAPYIGSTIGRFGNRMGNAKFSINGREYKLCNNWGQSTMHAGRKAFDKLVWTAEEYSDGNGVYVRFELFTPDGHEGFPGNCKATVTYGLTRSNELTVDYFATVDAPCPVNFTNHAYFNLAGEGNGTILDHEVLIHAEKMLEFIGPDTLPSGKILPVAGTPFDFRTRKKVSANIGETGLGYDHCFVINGDSGKMRPCTEVFEPSSGRKMKISTTQPGVQLYTGNLLDGTPGKIGSVLAKHSGLCLETQGFPDAPNHPEFPSAIFGPEKPYHEKALFAFEW